MLTFDAPDGTRLAYYRKGSGGDQPLVCIPGGPMMRSAYFGDLGGLAAQRELVLLDLLMPKMNGREFLARIRAMSNYAALPVLLITSETRIEGSDLQPSENCGVLTKPILPQDLIKEVRRLLKENSRETEARA